MAAKNRITLEAIDGGVRFTFINCDHYLQNGTIDVPLNSLSLIFDESDMATFRKAASNDIFISAPISYFYGLDTKEGLADFYTGNMVGSTGGGGSLEYYSEEEGQALIEVPSNIDGTNGVDVFNNGVNIYANEEQVGETSLYVSPTAVTINDDPVVTESMLDDYATVQNLEDTEEALAQSINVLSASLSGKADTSATTVDEYTIYATRYNNVYNTTASVPITWLKFYPKSNAATTANFQFSGITGYLTLYNIDYANGRYVVAPNSQVQPSQVSGLSITFEDGAMIVEVDGSNPITNASIMNTVVEYVKEVIPQKVASDAIYDNVYPLIKKVDDSLTSVTINSASTAQNTISLRLRNNGNTTITNPSVNLGGYLTYSGTTLKAEAYVNTGTDTLTTVAPTINSTSRTDYYFIDNVGQTAEANHIEIEILTGDTINLAFYGYDNTGRLTSRALVVANGTVTSGYGWPSEATYSLSDGVLTVDYAYTGTSAGNPLAINRIMATNQYGSTASVSDIVGYVKALLKDKVEVTEYIDNTLKPTIGDIEDSLSGKADTSAVTAAIDAVNASLSGKADTTLVNAIAGQVVTKVAISTYNAYTAATNTALSAKADVSAVTAIAEALDDYATVQDLEDSEEVIAQSINVLSDSLSGKQDTLIAGSGITISGNVISADGGGGSITIDPTLDTGSTNAVANSAITDAFNVYTLKRNSENGEVRYFYVPSPSQPYGGGGQLFSNFSINGRCPLTQSNGTNSYIDKFSLVETSAITTSMTSGSTDSQVPSAKAVYDTLGGLKFVKCSQAQYDALVTKDPNTLYIIDNVVNNNS